MKERIGMKGYMQLREKQTLTIEFEPKSNEMNTHTLMQSEVIAGGLAFIFADLYENEDDLDKMLNSIRDGWIDIKAKGSL